MGINNNSLALRKRNFKRVGKNVYDVSGIGEDEDQNG
jgi:hypothetical protein